MMDLLIKSDGAYVKLCPSGQAATRVFIAISKDRGLFRYFVLEKNCNFDANQWLRLQVGLAQTVTARAVVDSTLGWPRQNRRSTGERACLGTGRW